MLRGELGHSRHQGARIGLRPVLLPPLILREDATSPSVVAALVGRRLAQAYDEACVAPPNVLWPFDEAFCREVQGLVPRQVLRRCDAYRQSCQRSGEVVPWSARGKGEAEPVAGRDLEAMFDKLRGEAVPPSREALYAGEGDVLAGLLRFAA